MPAAERPLLEVRSVSKRFAGLLAVDRATFDVAPRTITALIGPNGAGKSTLFNVLTGFQRGDGGDVVFDGQSVYGRAPHTIARKGMVRTFQLTKALAVMSVIDNMLLARPTAASGCCWLRSGPRGGGPSVPHASAQSSSSTSSGSPRRPGLRRTLSGGQRKLLELAALSCSSRGCSCSTSRSPASTGRSGLAPRAHRAAAAERDVTILLVEHDMDVVMRHSDTVVVMGEGRVITSGPPEEIREDPRVIEAYLGMEAAHGGLDA